MLSKNFDHFFWLFYRNTIFLLTGPTSASFNISNFILNHSQVFNQINVPKKLHAVFIGKTCVLECVLIKLQASNLQSETLIKKEISAQGFPVNFAKLIRVLFYKTASSTWLHVIVYFSPTFVFLLRRSPTSINLVSLESYCQVEHHFILFL